MKRLLALLLALVLLTGVACAEGLKPRRDAVETPAEESTPSTGPAALPEAETDDLPAAPSTREEEPTRETPDVPRRARGRNHPPASSLAATRNTTRKGMRRTNLIPPRTMRTRAPKRWKARSPSTRTA